MQTRRKFSHGDAYSLIAHFKILISAKKINFLISKLTKLSRNIPPPIIPLATLPKPDNHVTVNIQHFVLSLLNSNSLVYSAFSRLFLRSPDGDCCRDSVRRPSLVSQ